MAEATFTDRRGQIHGTQVCITMLGATWAHVVTRIGWMIDLQFYVFSTLFQSYQDDGWVIMKGCGEWNLFMAEKILTQVELKLKIARSVGQCLTH